MAQATLKKKRERKAGVKACFLLFQTVDNSLAFLCHEANV